MIVFCSERGADIQATVHMIGLFTFKADVCSLGCRTSYIDGPPGRVFLSQALVLVTTERQVSTSRRVFWL